MHPAVRLAAFFAIVSFTFAALFARQDIPSCAATCLENADTTCSQTNYTCLCNDRVFLNTTTTCVSLHCSGNDLKEAENTAESLCKAVGVTITATTDLSTTSTSATASKSAASTTSTTQSNGASLASSNGMILGIVAALTFVVG